MSEVHSRPVVGVSQKSIFKRPCRFLATNAHKMAPRPHLGYPHIGPFVDGPLQPQSMRTPPVCSRPERERLAGHTFRSSVGGNARFIVLE